MGKGDLVINGVEIYDANVLTNTAQKKVEAINNFSAETGVTASLTNRLVFDLSSKYAITNVSTGSVVINRTAAAIGSSISALVTNINAVTATTGVTAEAKGGNLVLQASGLSQITIADQFPSSAGIDPGTTDFILDGTYWASIKLKSIDNEPIAIEIGEGSTEEHTDLVIHGFLEANVGAADFDVNEPTMGIGGGNSMSGLTVGTQTMARDALGILDKAIDRVNSIRGNLGAIRNRLNYTLDNLSSVSNKTEAATGRILDADFAEETSKLTRTSILGQAATSMLAQANQTKQNILVLFRGFG